MQLLRQAQKISTSRQGSILLAASLLGVTFFLSALLGFIRSRLLYAHFYSCCAATLDVFNAAFRIPDMLFSLLVGGALTSSFIPVFSSFLAKDKKEAQHLANAVLSFLLLVFSFIGAVVFIFAHPISTWMAHGFSPSQISLLTSLTRLLLFAQICFLVSNFITGIIQTHQVFLIPALAPSVYNLAIIFGIIVLSPFFGIYGPILGVVVGALLHLLIQLPVALRLGFKFRWNFDRSTPGLLKVLTLMAPRSLSLGLAEIESTLVLSWATGFTAGSLSLFRLALQVVYLPSRIFGVALGQASLPTLSANMAKNDTTAFKNTLIKAILQSVFIASPITIICLVNRLPIIRLAYGSRSFPWSATLQTAQTLAFLTPTIFAQALIQIINRAFYAVHNTKLPLYVAVFSLLITIIVGTYTSQNTNLQNLGLALAISAGSLTQLIGLSLTFNRIFPNLPIKQLLVDGLKLIVASILMGLTVWWSMRSLDIYILDTTKTSNVFLVFLGSSAFGAAVYISILVLLRSEECLWLLKKIKLHRFLP